MTMQDEKTLFEKAAFIRKLLDLLYPDIECFLRHDDPFTLLVAVVLSAQTTDKVVNKVTPELFKVASSPNDLLQLSEEKLRKIIEPIGLAARKAKALKGLAEKLCCDFEGVVPQTFEELESLPGVGHKTASVVMSQAFGKPAFPVDTHIQRLACRWGFGNEKSIRITEENLKHYFPEECWLKLHLQLIQYGRDHCPAQRHVTKDCVICSWKPGMDPSKILSRKDKQVVEDKVVSSKPDKKKIRTNSPRHGTSSKYHLRSSSKK
ncbi:endonuclease III isoform 1 [Galdieria sulphuraria]|uniref:Endonuclease III isoform 1 n=1 Tax=Galdieria sulphuraria TaxID=130081 RepID=M2Y103_GALSU|nr:endonuclease III isoform 2 [Galdieria sulphuraria]XP_005706129.1 endonuclease III isoform 1 [Galdieria sulphuraria]EME29608.1 endonuclease III isoform 2 [Galdieria sulphuraria]EME29609.1 endonuclease III isoform 1 [Galdieria sulphuraria]|eukprot:XP_005706128.1 endonuclease III isoform 2 [Galdieria sulphuraria]